MKMLFLFLISTVIAEVGCEMNIFRCLYWFNKNNVIHTLKTVSVTIGLEMCLCGDEKWNRFVKKLKTIVI